MNKETLKNLLYGASTLFNLRGTTNPQHDTTSLENDWKLVMKDMKLNQLENKTETPKQ